MSGAIAQFVASPADLVKVQVQMEGKRLLMGKAPRLVFIVYTIEVFFFFFKQKCCRNVFFFLIFIIYVK